MYFFYPYEFESIIMFPNHLLLAVIYVRKPTWTTTIEKWFRIPCYTIWNCFRITLIWVGKVAAASLPNRPNQIFYRGSFLPFAKWRLCQSSHYSIDFKCRFYQYVWKCQPFPDGIWKVESWKWKVILEFKKLFKKYFFYLATLIV